MCCVRFRWTRTLARPLVSIRTSLCLDKYCGLEEVIAIAYDAIAFTACWRKYSRSCFLYAQFPHSSAVELDLAGPGVLTKSLIAFLIATVADWLWWELKWHDRDASAHRSPCSLWSGARPVLLTLVGRSYFGTANNFRGNGNGVWVFGAERTPRWRSGKIFHS